MKINKKILIGSGITAVTAVLVLGCVLRGTAGTQVFGNPDPSPIAKNAETSKAFEVQKTFREIYDLYSDTVVFISTEQTVKVQQNPFFNDPFFDQFMGNAQGGARMQKRQGLGTGFVISPDGYICTNYHVVNGVDKVTVKLGSKTYEAVVVGSDERTDIALIKIDTNEKLKAAYLGDSDQVRVGDWAIAIGNPFGLDRTFTVGVISATGRKDLDMMGGTLSHIQTDASINPGNSGGPLINISGEVIGINRAIISESGGSVGIGFAIPINTAKKILAELKSNKKIKRGFIGVSLSPLTDDYAKELGLSSVKGALVGGVINGGPADLGGVKVGDVIIRAGDKEILNYGDLIEVVENTPVGKTIPLVVWREKREQTLFITVKERP